LNEAAGVGTNLAEGQPALAGTLTGAVTGMDQPPVPPAEPEAPPPDAAPAATATPAAPAEPLQLKPGYGQEGGQIGPPDMGEAAQQKTMGGVLDNIEQVSPEQAVQQGLIKPEQTGDFQQIQQMTQSLKQLREGASPEQLGPMMQEAQAEIANPESPTAQKATGGIMEQLGTTWDKARELWNGLSDGEKFLLGLGLSLGAVSLISGFAGERGPMTWVLGALGLGTAAGAAAHGGLLGEGPKGLLQGAEDYVTGLFGESNKPAPPPLSASPAPEATPEAVPSPAPAAPATPPPTAGTTASGGATATTPTVNSIMADNAVSPAEAQQVMKNPALRQQALNDPRAPSIVRMAMQSDPAFAKNMKALKGAPASVAMQILTAPEGQPVRTIGGTYPGAGLPPADAQKLYDLAQAV